MENSNKLKSIKVNSAIFFNRNKYDAAGEIVGHPDDIYKSHDQIERVKWLVSQNMQKSIMEIGTACGYVLNKVDGQIGVDIRSDRLLVAKKKYPSRTFYSGDILYQIPSCGIDIKSIIIAEVLEHIKFELVPQAIINCLNIAPTLYYTLPNIDKDINVSKNIEHLWYPTIENTKYVMNIVNNNVKINYDIKIISNFLCGIIKKI